MAIVTSPCHSDPYVNWYLCIRMPFRYDCTRSAPRFAAEGQPLTKQVWSFQDPQQIRHPRNSRWLRPQTTPGLVLGSVLSDPLDYCSEWGRIALDYWAILRKELHLFEWPFGSSLVILYRIQKIPEAAKFKIPDRDA